MINTIAIVPIKLNNRRLPNKNITPFTNGKPLCHYVLSTLLTIPSIQSIYVYCSNPYIQNFIPSGVKFLKRSERLDTDSAKMNEVLLDFANDIYADIYVMTHATAPFISRTSIEQGLAAVHSGKYDSAFAVKKLQDFLWKDGEPFNYELNNIPRTQDLPALYEETSGFYIYKREVITQLNRRIGQKPFIVEVDEIESIDIDEAKDFVMADAIFNFMYLTKNENNTAGKESGYTLNKINILDCTLRDGGYCNEWCFGFENARKIIVASLEANIDIVECGFLTNKITNYDPNVTKFTTVDQVNRLIPENREGKLFVVMMNYGEYNIDDLPEHDASSIDGIRVAFHKRNLNEALDLCEQIKAKGYLVFIQAMVSLCYTDHEFLSMINRINAFEPYAFYIVDSFGMMKAKDLTRFFYMVEHNLKENIWIGFHSHNNMQLSYSNAQALTRMQTKRNLIIDSSIMGMGRGAGNLNTELFLEYLNDNFGTKYDIKPLLGVIDKILNNFYQRNYWGYSLPNYISAAHNAHPNYARYLDEKGTLPIEAMQDIFDLMDEDKKVSYDKNYIENLYLNYMNRGKIHDEHKNTFKELLSGKKVFIIAPGKSSIEEKDKIISFASKDDVLTISINFDYDFYKSDFIFISNLRRFKGLDSMNYPRCIITSNIPADNVYYQVKYRDLLNDEDAVRDNASLLAINFLIKQGVKEIYLAGIDGYSHDTRENYGKDDMAFFTRNAILDAMNVGMCKVLKTYSSKISIKFVTTPKFVRID